MNFYWLSYDIPETSRITNPSGFLRRRAVRIQYSVWVVREDMIPHTRIHDMNAGGARVDLVRFDSSEADNLLRMIREALSAQLAEAARSAGRSLERAEEKLAGSDQSPDKAQAAFERSGRKITRRVEKLVGDLAEAARRLGIDPQTLETSPETALGAVTRLHENALGRARAYVEMSQTLAGLDETGDELARAARLDLAEPEALLDHLDIHGQDTELAHAIFDPVA